MIFDIASVAQMFDDAPIDEAMAILGYRRQRNLVYQAGWSTPEIEQFISFYRYGTANAFLTANFGLRQEMDWAAAHEFSHTLPQIANLPPTTSFDLKYGYTPGEMAADAFARNLLGFTTNPGQFSRRPVQ